MDVKEYLEQVRNQERLIEQYNDIVYELKEKMKYTHVSFDSVGSNPNKNTSSPQSRLINKYMEFQEKLENIVIEYLDTKEEVIENISKLKNNTHKEIMIRHYIKGEEWLDIADKVGFSISNVFRINKQCLSALDNIINQGSQNK